MGYLPEKDPGPGFEPFASLHKSLGYIPNLFRAQTLMPDVVEAEVRVVSRILFQESALSRVQKERILLLVAAEEGSAYCVTAAWRMLERLGSPATEPECIIADPRKAGLASREAALLGFCLKLARHPTAIREADVDSLREAGHDDAAILEAVLTTALTQTFCCLSAGLGILPDFEPPRWKRKGNGSASRRAGGPGAAGRPQGSPGYLKSLDLSPDSFPPFAFFREKLGFVPRIFQAQTLRPDVVAAEAAMLDAVLLGAGPLDRVRKEMLLLAISAANLNTYCVALHSEMLRRLGIPEERCDQMVLDPRLAGLTPADAALLEAALKLATRAREWDESDLQALRGHGFTPPQILDAVVIASLAIFLNTVQMGLGTDADFEPRLRFSEGVPRRSEAGASEDKRAPSKSFEVGPSAPGSAAARPIVRRGPAAQP